MKKIFLLFSAIVIASLSIKAQTPITITQSDMPVPGEVFIEAIDTTYSGISLGNAGANQVWNLTNLENHVQDTTLMLLPSTLPGYSGFPTATVASVQQGNMQMFYKSSATAYNMLGFYGDFLQSGSSTVVKYNPPLTYVKLPCTYGTTNSGTSTFELVMPFANPPVDSMKFHLSMSYSSNVDAWGTITTPSFTNVACIRQKTNTLSIVDLSVHVAMVGWIPTGSPTRDTSTAYTWFSNIAHSAIATINVDSNGTIASASYLLSKHTVGLNELAGKTNNSSQVYPNPSSDVLNISGITTPSEMLVLDITGKIIDKRMLSAKQTSFSVSGYQPGIYFYQITESGSNSVSKGKFAVVR